MDIQYCDICKKHGFRSIANHTITEYDKEIYLCDDCAIDHFGIGVYIQPKFKCSGCGSDCNGDHYTNDHGCHFCSPKCAVNYHKFYYGIKE